MMAKGVDPTATSSTSMFGRRWYSCAGRSLLRLLCGFRTGWLLDSTTSSFTSVLDVVRWWRVHRGSGALFLHLRDLGEWFLSLGSVGPWLYGGSGGVFSSAYAEASLQACKESIDLW